MNTNVFKGSVPAGIDYIEAQSITGRVIIRISAIALVQSLGEEGSLITLSSNNQLRLSMPYDEMRKLLGF